MRSSTVLRLWCAPALLSFTASVVLAAFSFSPAGADEPTASGWLDDYHAAVASAKEQQKMLLVWFLHPQSVPAGERYMESLWRHPQVAGSLSKYVTVKVPADLKIESEGKQICLISHPAFTEMLNREGLAIIDFANPKASYYGRVVSVFPFNRRWITQPHLTALLNLPAGTLTQRTLVWAVRTHPEAPASTWAQASEALLYEAECHSCHQASIRLQGHHQWESRFHRVSAQIGGLSAQEVCAESWPGQSLIDAAEECVSSWRQSPGHWNAVRSQSVAYGYDMKRGTNGIWYATGLFGRYH